MISETKVKEKFLIFVCPTCKTAKDVWYDTKGDSCDEDIYHCLKCRYYFTVSAVCDKCSGVHSRSYGCNTKGCSSMNYHYNHEEREVEREI